MADVRAKRDAEVALVKEIESKIESLWRQEGTKLQQAFSLLTEKMFTLHLSAAMQQDMMTTLLL